ncbi:Xaa-His dipeptidase [Clostridium cochlearium]|uniref:Xaa-His dipeptidase n=1 Tax=Clostridium cochlearium TaxID=1494 RepID=UPI000BBCCA26|nr:Xaa-His dipeptidase [Clostridium cochlearium]
MRSVEDVIKDNLNVIEVMAEQGSTDKEIATKLGIGYSTYKKYKSKDVDLKAVLAIAKDKKNQEVEKALFRNATGYHYYEEVVTKVKLEELAEDGTTILSKEDVKISNVKKYKGPDLNAQKYWLNNKDKMHWKDDPHKVANDKKLTKLKEKEINSKVIEI